MERDGGWDKDRVYEGWEDETNREVLETRGR